MASAVNSLAGRASVLSRHRGPHHPDTIAARTEHAVALLADEIGKQLAREIELTDEQVTELAALLRAGVKP
jgi:hypothetical protein